MQPVGDDEEVRRGRPPVGAPAHPVGARRADHVLVNVEAGGDGVAGDGHERRAGRAVGGGGSRAREGGPRAPRGAGGGGGGGGTATATGGSAAQRLY